MKDTKLARSFRQTAEAFFSRCQGLSPKWNNSSGDVDLELEIPPKGEGGFAVTVMVRDQEIIVFGAGAHHHFDENKDPQVLVSEAFGLVYDLLSSGMRIIEFTGGGKPYKWQMQVFQDNEWYTEVTTGLLVWRFFSKKEKHILQNNLVPRREEMLVEQGN